MSLPFRRTRNSLAIFALLFFCNVYFFPRWADPNQNSRLDMVIAVVEDGTFQIDPYVGNTVDYAKVGAHYYSDKAPGAAFLGIPIYAGLRIVLDSPLLVNLNERIGKSEAFGTTLRAGGSGVNTEKIRFALAQVVLSLFISALPSALLGVLLYRTLDHFGVSAGTVLIIVFGYALLTPAFAYANAFYGHQLSAALLFAVFYLAMRNQGVRNVLDAVVIGLLLGYSVVTEYPVVLMAGTLFVYVFYLLYRQGRIIYILPVVLAGGIVALAWMGYNTAVFGGPLDLGYSHSELWVEQHQSGFMSLTVPHWQALWGITFSHFRGLFFLAPWLLLAVPGFLFWWRANRWRAEWWVAMASITSMVLFNASSGMWWGGFAVGPRYLLPVLPFIAMGAAFALIHWHQRIWFGGTVLLLFTYSAICVWGLSLAGQAFPPDSLRRPLFDYALPNWQQGNLARNMGTLLGLEGIWSLVPFFLVLGVGSWIVTTLARRDHQARTIPDVKSDLTAHTLLNPSHR